MKHQIASIIAAAAMFAQPALAQHRAPAAQPPVITGPLRLDQRYQFDHYYPGPGFTMPRLPDRSVRVPHGGAEWYFHGGVWFRPSAAGFIVDVPPFGIVVPVLPPAYVTLWIDGLPYYYANGVYYTTAQDGYAVVAPPRGPKSRNQRLRRFTSIRAPDSRISKQTPTGQPAMSGPRHSLA